MGKLKKPERKSTSSILNDLAYANYDLAYVNYREPIYDYSTHRHIPKNSNPINKLYAAVRNKDVDTVRIILEENKHVKDFLKQKTFGELDPILATAVLYSDGLASPLQIIELLIEYGADINQGGGIVSCGTPIEIAAKNLKVELVNYFIELGANLLGRSAFLQRNLLQEVINKSSKFQLNKVTAMLELLVPAIRKAGMPESEIEAARHEAESLRVFNYATYPYECKTVNVWPQKLWQKNPVDAQLVPYQYSYANFQQALFADQEFDFVNEEDANEEFELLGDEEVSSAVSSSPKI
jgi:hypothetical protein